MRTLFPYTTLFRSLALAGQAEFILGYHHQRAAGLAAARARKQDNTADQGDPR